MPSRVVKRSAAILLLSILLFEFTSGTPLDNSWVTNLGLLFAILISICVLFIAPLFIGFRNWRLTLLGFFVALAGGWWLVGSFGQGGDRVIGSIKMNDGREICLLHTYSGDFADPYHVELCFRKSDGTWKQYLVRRGDTRWWIGSISLKADSKEIIVRKFVFPTARFSLATEQLTWLPSGTKLDGKVSAPTWSPESEIKLNRLRAALP